MISTGTCEKPSAPAQNTSNYKQKNPQDHFSWDGWNRGSRERWSLHRGKTHLYAKQVERSEDIMGGGAEINQSATCLREPAPTTFVQAAFVCRGERASFNVDRKKRGAAVLWGFPHFNSLHAHKLQPPFPTEITVQRKSVPKPREGGPGPHPPPAWSLLATQQL